MRALFRVPVVFLGLQLGYSGLLWACDRGFLPGTFLWDDPTAAVEELDVIFVGEIVRVWWGSPGCGGDMLPVSLEVTRAVKGVQVGERIDVDIDMWRGTSCARSKPEEGDIWLVGLFESEDGRRPQPYPVPSFESGERDKLLAELEDAVEDAG